MQPLMQFKHAARLKSALLTAIGLLAIGAASSITNVIWAQRGAVPPAVPEARGPDMAPAKRDFGDLSVAFRNLARQALPSIVSIEAMSRPTRACEGPAWQHVAGSGFVVGPAGAILTSSQLVFGADRVKVRLRDGSKYFASSVRMDPRSNVAVVQISPVGRLAALPMGDSDSMQVGDWVMALGRTSQLTPSAEIGIVNAMVPGPGISRGEDFFQTSAIGNLGGNGGPLLNLNGQVVGINSSASRWDEELNPGGLAAPSNLVNWSSRQLIDNGVVNRGFLGVTSQPMTPLMAKHFHVPLGEGALVNRVIADSAAADAKIKAGDIITRIDGKPVIDSRHLQSVTERLDPGKTYPVEIIRDGQRIILNVKAGKMPDQMNLTPRSRRAGAGLNERPKSFADLGLVVKEATPEQIRQARFGDGIHGVMIDSVQPNSAAAIAGLQKGMIVERIGNKNVTSVQEFNTTEKDIAANNGVVVYVQTRQGPKFVAVGPDDI